MALVPWEVPMALNVALYAAWTEAYGAVVGRMLARAET